jgi:hypothetical protein
MTVDPRIPWERYAATETFGQRMSSLVEGILAVWSPREPWHLLSDGHRALFVIHFALAEIDGGGLDQFYRNSAGDFARELPTAARFFGADAYARIFECANGLFELGSLASTEARNLELDSFAADGRGDELERLTDELFALEDRGDFLDRYVLRYVESHRRDFFQGDP